MASDFPAGLGERGAELWKEAVETWRLSPAHLVLLEEACRITDRLDVLNAIILRGSAQVNTNEGELPDIQGVLAETRQQAGALRMLIAEIRQGQVGFAPAAPGSEQEATGVLDLSARIARKKAEG
jgi:hypothetical protein